MMEIREVCLNDIQDIQLLNENQMGYVYPVEKTKQKIEKIIMSSHDKMFVAVKDGHVIGYVHAVDYDVVYMDHLKNIMGIAVKEGYQKQGVGRQLLSQVEDWAKDDGAMGMRLVSGETRKEAHLFYQHCGYISHKKQFHFIKMLKEEEK